MNTIWRNRLLAGAAATVLTSGAAFAQSPAPARAAGPPPAAQIDSQSLPAVSGTVAHYTLTPRGDVDGLVLSDGTEIHVPPRLSSQLVFIAKPGDKVTVHGLKALNEKLVDAVSVTNDATGQQVTDSGARGFGRPGRGPAAMQAMQAQGTIQEVLHGPRGEVNGAMLNDGTILRLPPPEAARLASLLQPGATVAVQGRGMANALGRVIAVTQIGPNATQLTAVATPRPHGPHGPHGHGPHGGRGHGPGGGPDRPDAG